MLELSSVSKSFGGLHVLHDVNLSVPQGSIYGLIGPNGAGKTTVFNLITGLLPPSGGAITFNGDSLLRRAPHQITRMGIARTFQNIRLFKEMTLLENVVVGAYRHMNYGFPSLLLGLPGFREHEKRARERAHELLTWMRLDHKANDRRQPVLRRTAPAGAGARAGHRAQAAVAGRAGRGHEHRRARRAHARDPAIRERGYTILMIEHDMRFVMGLCEQIAVLNFGKIIACGGPEEIRNNEQVIEAYLGREDDEDAEHAEAAK